MILREINDLEKLQKKEWSINEYIELLKRGTTSKIVNHIINTNKLYKLLKPNDIKNMLNNYYDQNIYFITLYILLSSTDDRQLIIYEEILRKLTNCENKYQIKQNFIVKVIKEPIQKINKETDFDISITSLTQNKKVVAWILDKEMQNND